MKYNSSLRHNLKKITEDQLPSDSWFKEYMQDVRNGEGWVHIDKVMQDISDTLDLDLYGKAGEVARTIRRLGYGNYLRESAKAKTLREDTWNDYYKKIEDVDFDEKTGSSKYKTRKELEAALKKAYGWDVNNPNVKEAIDRWYNSHDDIDRFGESAVRKAKGRKITEATTRGETDIELSNTSGVLKLITNTYGVTLEMWAGGNGYRDTWKNPQFAEKLDRYYTSQDKVLEKELRKEYASLYDDVLKAANAFDKEVERVMNKHGFKK